MFKLFEAALSVPIRLRLNPDTDCCQLMSLTFSESMFAHCGATGAQSFRKFTQKVCELSNVKKAISSNASIPKLLAAVKQCGVSF